MLDRLRLPLLLAWPSLALFGLVVVPFAMLVRISFGTPGLEDLGGSGFIAASSWHCCIRSVLPFWSRRPAWDWACL
jgi:hypothetical protein